MAVTNVSLRDWHEPNSGHEFASPIGFETYQNSSGRETCHQTTLVTHTAEGVSESASCPELRRSRAVCQNLGLDVFRHTPAIQPFTFKIPLLGPLVVAANGGTPLHALGREHCIP